MTSSHHAPSYRFTLGLSMAFFVLVVDQLSKWWIISVEKLPLLGSVQIFPGLNFTMVWNRAITFGMLEHIGASGPLIFILFALLAVIFLSLQLWRTQRLCVAIAIGGIIGGAIGNVIDRLRYGAVVDFIHLHAYGWSWYVFNGADSAIVVGVILWMLDSLMRERRG